MVSPKIFQEVYISFGSMHTQVESRVGKTARTYEGGAMDEDEAGMPASCKH